MYYIDIQTELYKSYIFYFIIRHRKPFYASHYYIVKYLHYYSCYPPFKWKHIYINYIVTS